MIDISIHALREEGDVCDGIKPAFSNTFLSTPSARRATQDDIFVRRSDNDFYPRPPRGGRPLDLVTIGADDDISIHALREEGDLWA